MGTPTPVILSVSTPAYGEVVVTASDGMRYYADLRNFSAVYCFPKTEEEWGRVSPDAAGLALTWTTRFEVHVDQIQGVAHRVEPAKETA